MKQPTENKPGRILTTYYEKVEISELYSLAGFTEQFWEATRTSRTNRAAYEIVEARHAAIFGVRKYASYDSFRTVRNRRIKAPAQRSLEKSLND